jgi:hypothetical protein
VIEKSERNDLVGVELTTDVARELLALALDVFVGAQHEVDRRSGAGLSRIERRVKSLFCVNA